MKLHSLLLAGLIATLAAFFLACSDDDDNDETDANNSTPTAESQDDAFPVTLTDDLGAELTLEEPPERIVALAPSFVEVLYAVGAGDTIVAADQNTDYPPEAESIPKISAFEPSVEGIASYEPDVVLYFYDPGGLQDAMNGLNIKNFYLATPTTVDGVYEQIETIGALTGKSAEAEEVVGEMQSDIDAILEGLDTTAAPRVFHEFDPLLFTVGPGSFQDDVYTMLGATNIAEPTGEPFPQLSQEAVIAGNPEVIILADADFGESAETVAARPGWSQISAVQNERVYGVNSALLSHPSPRLVDDIEELAALLYPEGAE